MTASATETQIELRCPIGFRALLGSVIANGQSVVHVDRETNLVELLCRDCTKRARHIDPRIYHVFHRYNVMGDLVETIANER